MEKAESDILINKMLTTLGELPSSPKIVAAVVRMTSDPETDIAQLEKLLSADQSLAAKLLKLSNSAFYGQRKSISTLRQAILIVGFYTLRSLVMAASIHSLYSNKSKTSVEYKLWEHSLAAAIVCRILAKKLGHFHIEEIFMAGLLHDIGKLVMTQKLGKNYEELCKKVETEHTKFIDEEMAGFGFTHCDVGMMLLNKWNLPAELSNAVYMHHTPELPDDQRLQNMEPAKIPIEFVLQLGNYLAKSERLGFRDFRMENLEELEIVKALNFSMEDLQAIHEELEAEFDSELALFEG
jgi:putative nucleotidyltransferase with HDIG domain